MVKTYYKKDEFQVDDGGRYENSKHLDKES